VIASNIGVAYSAGCLVLEEEYCHVAGSAAASEGIGKYVVITLSIL